MELPLLHNDAVQWAVVRVPAAVAPGATPCCLLAGDVGGGATPPASSSGAAQANIVIWCVILLLGFGYSCFVIFEDCDRGIATGFLLRE